MDDRSFVNEFDKENSDHTVPTSFCEEIKKALAEQKVYLTNPSSYAALLGVSERAVDPPDDGTVYTGRAGLALLYLKMGELDLAGEVARESLETVSSSRPTFLTGFPGPLAILAAVEGRRGRTVDLAPLLALAPQVCSPASSLPDELLYGRAGYLFTLLFLRKEVGVEQVGSEVVRRVVEAILASGRALAGELCSRAPLMWAWHDKVYFGAAHGIAGIITVLLQASDHITPAEMVEQVRPTLDYLVNTAFISGNFPSSKGNDKDRLVHWCHGAPGVVHALLLGHRAWPTAGYLDAAIKAGELVWERGLLKKGNGLCHGSAGNGYAFIHLYQVTGDNVWLHRATCFARWSCNLARPELRKPDRPLSLFEGLSGTSYFLHDMLSPSQARFPGLLV